MDRSHLADGFLSIRESPSVSTPTRMSRYRTFSAVFTNLSTPVSVPSRPVSNDAYLFPFLCLEEERATMSKICNLATTRWRKRQRKRERRVYARLINIENLGCNEIFIKRRKKENTDLFVQLKFSYTIEHSRGRVRRRVDKF